MFRLLIVTCLFGFEAFADCHPETVLTGSYVRIVTVCDQGAPVQQFAPLQPANMGGHNDDLYQGIDRFQRGMRDLRDMDQ